jgi:hypothetical protein
MLINSQEYLFLCGPPTDETRNKITSEGARNCIRSLPKMKKKNFHEFFKGANPLAIDLLERMLELDADNRITARVGPPLPGPVRRPHGRVDVAALRPNFRRL